MSILKKNKFRFRENSKHSRRRVFEKLERTKVGDGFKSVDLGVEPEFDADAQDYSEYHAGFHRIKIELTKQLDVGNNHTTDQFFDAAAKAYPEDSDFHEFLDNCHPDDEIDLTYIGKYGKYTDTFSLDEFYSELERHYSDYNESKIPNLAENYKRLFGKLDECDFSGRKVTPKSPIQSLNESDMKKWMKLNRSFAAQCPNRKLTLSEGNVRLDGYLVEPISKFAKRDLGSMIEVLRNVARSIKK